MTINLTVEGQILHDKADKDKRAYVNLAICIKETIGDDSRPLAYSHITAYPAGKSNENNRVLYNKFQNIKNLQLSHYKKKQEKLKKSRAISERIDVIEDFKDLELCLKGIDRLLTQDRFKLSTRNIMMLIDNLKETATNSDAIFVDEESTISASKNPPKPPKSKPKSNTETRKNPNWGMF